MAALRQQLEEAIKLKDLAEKARLQDEDDRIKAEKERDEAEQHGYDVGVAETEDALRAEVLQSVVPIAPRLGRKPSTKLELTSPPS